MGIKIMKREFNPYVQDSILEFLCDTDADFASLPNASTGSSAVSIGSGNKQMVNTSGVWVPFGTPVPVSDVEASIDENGVLTMRSGLDSIRFYNVGIWRNRDEIENAPLAMTEFYPEPYVSPFEVSVPLYDVFRMCDWGEIPADGDNLYVRVTADNDGDNPYCDIETTWRSAWKSDKGDVFECIESMESDGWYGEPSCEPGKEYYIENTKFTAISTYSCDAVPPAGTEFEHCGSTYRVLDDQDDGHGHMFRIWNVSGGDYARDIFTIYKVDGEDYSW